MNRVLLRLAWEAGLEEGFHRAKVGDPISEKFDSWYEANKGEVSGWIDCKVRLPENGKQVLTYGRMSGYRQGDEIMLFPWRIAVGCYNSNVWGCFVEYFGDVFEQASEVTHWALLPEPPP